MSETPRASKPNPFDVPPVYETERFLFTIVDIPDAADLFLCYSDETTLSHMNNDNCNGEFRCADVEAMEEMVRSWRKDFENRDYIRWSIRVKATGRVVGTVEIAPIPYVQKFFGSAPPLGILRIDLLSSFEREDVFREITGMMSGEMAADFGVSGLITKAPPQEPDRAAALISLGFLPDTGGKIPFAHYYIHALGGRRPL